MTNLFPETWSKFHVLHYVKDFKQIPTWFVSNRISRVATCSMIWYPTQCLLNFMKMYFMKIILVSRVGLLLAILDEIFFICYKVSIHLNTSSIFWWQQFDPNPRQEHINYQISPNSFIPSCLDEVVVLFDEAYEIFSDCRNEDFNALIHHILTKKRIECFPFMHNISKFHDTTTDMQHDKTYSIKAQKVPSFRAKMYLNACMFLFSFVAIFSFQRAQNALNSENCQNFPLGHPLINPT